VSGDKKGRGFVVKFEDGWEHTKNERNQIEGPGCVAKHGCSVGVWQGGTNVSLTKMLTDKNFARSDCSTVGAHFPLPYSKVAKEMFGYGELDRSTGSK
jgi:hypothetical protein